MSKGYAENEVGLRHTWTNVPLGLETCHACETCHGDKVEEYLSDTEHDHGFGDDHLRNGTVSRETKCNRRRLRCRHVDGRELTSSSKLTMPWFPLPMPENEVGLLDGLKRSTRPATVSESPMRSWRGFGVVEDLEREVVAAYSPRSPTDGWNHALQIAALPTRPNCHLPCRTQCIILSILLFPVDLQKYYSSDPLSPPRELTVRVSSSRARTVP